jgi:hypothetical protein
MVQAAADRYHQLGLGWLYHPEAGAVTIRSKRAAPQLGLDGRVKLVHLVEKVFQRGATLDFIGHHRGQPVAFEAKHTSTGRIRWDAVTDRQAEALTAHEVGLSEDWDGAFPRTFVLVSFGMARWFAVPWSWWEIPRYAHGRRAPWASKHAASFSLVDADRDWREFEVVMRRGFLDFMSEGGN